MPDTTSTDTHNTLPPFGAAPKQIQAVLLGEPDNPVLYGGYYQSARLTYEQIDSVIGHHGWNGTCWLCERAFVPGNVSIVVARQEGHGPDEEVPYSHLYFHHPGCWEDRQRNFGDPWPIPDGPITWRASDPKPGRATDGNIGLDDEGTVTILAHGQPVIGIDVRAGTVFTWPDGDEHVVVARFTPIT